MEAEMTREKVLNALRTERAKWDALLAEVGEDRMEEPGAEGEWRVKDSIAHLTYYDKWMADRLHEQLQGETYTLNAWDMMHYEDRNKLIYERDRDLPLQEVLAASKLTFQRLMEAVGAHSEEFLTEPQQFAGAPQPIIVWQYLRSEVYGHYPDHIAPIRAWLDSKKSNS